jgi:hypothetical protein
VTFVTVAKSYCCMIRSAAESDNRTAPPEAMRRSARVALAVCRRIFIPGAERAASYRFVAEQNSQTIPCGLVSLTTNHRSISGHDCNCENLFGSRPPCGICSIVWVELSRPSRICMAFGVSRSCVSTIMSQTDSFGASAGSSNSTSAPSQSMKMSGLDLSLVRSVSVSARNAP